MHDRLLSCPHGGSLAARPARIGQCRRNACDQPMATKAHLLVEQCGVISGNQPSASRHYRLDGYAATQGIGTAPHVQRGGPVPAGHGE